MSKTLEERLRAIKSKVNKMDAALDDHASKLPTVVITQFKTIIAFFNDTEHLIEMIHIRSASRQYIDKLEESADQNDLVPFGITRIKYQHARLIGVQAYIANNWAISDRLTNIAGLIMCPSDITNNGNDPVKLLAQFIRKERTKKIPGVSSELIQQAFGWPIALSCAMRNHFIHDGGQLKGENFFAGQTARSGFRISDEGWSHIHNRAKSDAVSATHSQGNFDTRLQDDLRNLLDFCERDMDHALGILIGSASMLMLAHVGFMLGED